MSEVQQAQGWSSLNADRTHESVIFLHTLTVSARKTTNGALVQGTAHADQIHMGERRIRGRMLPT
jgi:hypothetical protein